MLQRARAGSRAAEVQWVTLQNTAFELSDCVASDEMDDEEAQTLVANTLNDCLGYCSHVKCPDYRWVVKRGTLKMLNQPGWTCNVCRVPLSGATNRRLFEDSYTATAFALGALESMCSGWARPGRQEGLADILPSLDMIGSGDPLDLQQPAGHTLWVSVALAVLAEFPHALKAIVRPASLSQDGKYTLHLYDYSKQNLVAVVVDDRIPKNHLGKPAFADLTQSSEIWPCIFEKALSKLAGGYENIMGGDSLFALGVFTGCRSLMAFEERPPRSGQWSVLKPDFRSANPQSDQNTRSPGTWPDGSDNSQQKTSDAVLKLLADFSHQGYLITCSQAGKGSRIAGKELHTVLAVHLDVASSERNMIQIRSYFGAEGWGGDWSDTSPLWADNPEIKQELGFSPSDDGTFWMEYGDFFENYSMLCVCCKDMGKNRQRLLLEKRSETIQMLEGMGINALVPTKKYSGRRSSITSTMAGGTRFFGPEANEEPKAPAATPKTQTRHLEVMRSAVVQTLEFGGASEAHQELFDLWHDTVLAPLVQRTPSGGRQLLLHSDLSQLEVRASGPQDLMLQLARDFSRACDLPGSGALARLGDLQDEVMAEELVLWCRLGRIGTASPAADVGYTIKEQIGWPVADLLMPPVEDLDALRGFAMQELHKPRSFSSSILPAEPERSLGFELVLQDPKRMILSALFFFKCLGFVKPDDAVVRVLGTCQPKRCSVSVAMGPQGLTRVSISLADPNSTTAADLARCLELTYKADEINRLRIGLGTDISGIEYIAGPRGFAVAVCFDC